VWSPDLLMKICAYNLVESNVEFRQSFIQLTSRLRIKTRNDRTKIREESLYTKKVLEEKDEILKELDKDLFTLACEEVVKLETGELVTHQLRRLQDRQRSGEITPHQVLSIQILKTALYFPNDYRTMCVGEFRESFTHLSELIAAHWIKNIRPLERKSKDLYNMYRHCGLPEQAPMMYQSFEQLEKVLTVLSIGGFSDMTTILEPSTIERRANEIEPLLDLSRLARHGRERMRLMPLKQRVMFKLDRELKKHGYTLERLITKVGKERVTTLRLTLSPHISPYIDRFVFDTSKEYNSGTKNLTGVFGYIEDERLFEAERLANRVREPKNRTGCKRIKSYHSSAT